MDAFLRTVDEAVPANLLDIIKGLADGGYTLPVHLDHADAAETIAEFPQDGNGKLLPAGKAFVRRAIAKASLKEVTVPQQQQLSVVQSSQPERLDELFGSEVSAESVAAALSGKHASVDVQDLLGKIHCSTLPPAMVLELAVWQALSADTEAAKKRGKSAYTFHTEGNGATLDGH